MKAKLILINLLTLIYLISIVNSANLEISGFINENTKVYSENILVNINCNETDYKLNLPENAKDIIYNNNSVNQNYILINNCESLNEISYNLDIIENIDNKKIRLERNFIFLKTDNYTYELKYPIEYILDKNNSIPKQYSLSLYDNYAKAIFKPNELFVLYFTKETDESNNFSISHFGDELTESNVLILILISFMFGGVSVYYYMKSNSKKPKNQTVPAFVLSTEEKKVLEVIKNNKGINQKQIGFILDYSKSRVSAIITELEQKQLIKREKFGRSFKVYINKEIV